MLILAANGTLGEATAEEEEDNRFSFSYERYHIGVKISHYELKSHCAPMGVDDRCMYTE
jgi:hypothetical protein